MSFMHDEPPDSVYLSSIDSFSSPPPLSLPDLPTPAVVSVCATIKPVRRAARPATSTAQRLALLMSRLLAAPTEDEVRQIAHDGVRALVRCRRVVLRLLDDPPTAFDPRAQSSAAGEAGNGAHLGAAEDTWLRIPILADHEVIGSLALEAWPGQRALTPSARATAETVAHALAQRLAHLRLLALAVPPATTPDAPAPAALRLAGACELMADAVLVADEAGRVVAVNSAFRQLFGVSREETAPGLPGAPLVEQAQQSLVPLDPPDPIGPATATCPRRYLQREPARRVLERRAHTIVAADGVCLGRVVSYRDITRDFDTTERQQRFLSAVAHELRTPLTSITGYAQLVMRELDRAERAEVAARVELQETAAGEARAAMRATMRTRMAALAGQSARMTRLLRDMLDMSYLETGRLPLRLETVEMVSLVAEAIGSLNAVSPPHRFALQMPRRLVLRGDGTRIEQIVRHLLENAIKFSPRGGTIQVTLRTRRGVDGMAWCVLSVRDGGAGVPAGWEEAIFAPFARPETAATRWFNGIGLGLSLSRALATQHGGTLRALPGQHTGATFELCLPLAGPRDPAGDGSPVSL